MTMKHFNLLLIALTMSASGVFAQSQATKRADKHFSRLEFVKAAADYESLVSKGNADAYVYSRLADCYYNVFNTVAAESYYAKALETSDDPELKYKYAQMLKANGKYDASNAAMREFASMRPGDQRATAFLANPNYIPSIVGGGQKFNIQNLDLNTEGSDFGGTLQGGKLYVTSSRNNQRRTYGWNNEPFLDIYQFTASDDGSYGAEQLMGPTVNTQYHEGVVSFSPDGNTMYLSRESYYEKEFIKDSLSRNKFSVLQLFKSEKQSTGWSEATPLSLNSQTYSVKNPSVSADGKTLYFASDMPSGYGGFDIYKATINADASLGEAVNLGQRVNTEGQEMFPFSSASGTLYFSSDGHLGLGGLDVFFTTDIGGKMTKIRSAGVPVNSAADDFAFHLDESNGTGFVSSNRPGGKGSDDVYALKQLEPVCDVNVVATVKDAVTGAILTGALVSLRDGDDNLVYTATTDDNGQVTFDLPCDVNSKLQGSMTDYENGSLDLDGSYEETVAVDLNLNPIDNLIVGDMVVLNPIYFDFDKSNITAKAAFELDKLVAVMQKYPQIKIYATSNTDRRGSDSYNVRLSDRRAKTTVQYVISKGIDESRIEGVGKGETELKDDCTSCTEAQHQSNRRSEFKIIEGNPKQ